MAMAMDMVCRPAALGLHRDRTGSATYSTVGELPTKGSPELRFARARFGTAPRYLWPVSRTSHVLRRVRHPSSVKEWSRSAG